ncbi:unnamed protein product [Vitrella brassicaformis CCMP3155]|uniref:FAD/NAD(P)-binding domain-containing protein n=2 Tax=Vitrella brassicaformis TaxID=1169539 RepID=A0A0G4ET23_VITBC|nr:unnamed protein product [Vitrella brassicaformis CCMP3155]|eukprot:CEM00861.1 unnamed protein product [Vitrella brassicaformis CCMP3155]
MDAAHAAYDTVIVGAGFSGLAIAAHLSKRGLSFVLIERSDRIGSSWKERYECLRLNTDKWTSSLPFLGFPCCEEVFPSRDAVVNYYESYAEIMGLRPQMRFNETVLSITPSPLSVWCVHTSSTTYHVRHVVLAAGPDRVPNTPTFPGQEAFTGSILHSSDFTTGRSFAHRKVLVIGFGNSAMDVALECCKNGADVSMFVRSPVVVVPRKPFGLPASLLSVIADFVPTCVSDALGNMITFLFFGRMSRYGLAKAPEGPYTAMLSGRIPVLDRGIMRAIYRRDIGVLPHRELSRFTSDGVCFDNETTYSFEVVVFCTGFTAGLESLVTSDMTEAKGVFRLGYETSYRGYFPATRRKARLIARALSERKRVSSPGSTVVVSMCSVRFVVDIIVCHLVPCGHEPEDNGMSDGWTAFILQTITFLCEVVFCAWLRQVWFFGNYPAFPWSDLSSELCCCTSCRRKYSEKEDHIEEILLDKRQQGDDTMMCSIDQAMAAVLSWVHGWVNRHRLLIHAAYRLISDVATVYLSRHPALLFSWHTGWLVKMRFWAFLFVLSNSQHVLGYYECRTAVAFVLSLVWAVPSLLWVFCATHVFTFLSSMAWLALSPLLLVIQCANFVFSLVDPILLLLAAAVDLVLSTVGIQGSHVEDGLQLLGPSVTCVCLGLGAFCLRFYLPASDSSRCAVLCPKRGHMAGLRQSFLRIYRAMVPHKDRAHAFAASAMASCGNVELESSSSGAARKSRRAPAIASSSSNSVGSMSIRDASRPLQGAELLAELNAVGHCGNPDSSSADANAARAKDEPQPTLPPPKQQPVNKREKPKKTDKKAAGKKKSSKGTRGTPVLPLAPPPPTPPTSVPEHDEEDAAQMPPEEQDAPDKEERELSPPARIEEVQASVDVEDADGEGGEWVAMTSRRKKKAAGAGGGGGGGRQDIATFRGHVGTATNHEAPAQDQGQEQRQAAAPSASPGPISPTPIIPATQGTILPKEEEQPDITLPPKPNHPPPPPPTANDASKAGSPRNKTHRASSHDGVEVGGDILRELETAWQLFDTANKQQEDKKQPVGQTQGSGGGGGIGAGGGDGDVSGSTVCCICLHAHPTELRAGWSGASDRRLCPKCNQVVAEVNLKVAATVSGC